MRYARPLGLMAALVLTLFFPLWADSATTSTVIFTLIFAGVATSWNMFSGYTGYMSLGHMVYYGLGAYTLAIICQGWHIPGGIEPLLLLPLAGVGAIPLCWMALRTRRYTFMVITLAIFFVFQVLAYNLPATNGSAGLFFPIPLWSAQVFNLPFYYVALLSLLSAVAVSRWLRYSKFGLGLLAIRDDEDRASGLGVKTGPYKLSAYALSAFFLGLAEALSAYFIGIMSPLTVFDPSLNVVVIAMVYLGGVGSLAGPLLGAALLEPLQQFLTLQFGALPGLNLLVYGCLLLIVILVLPEGIVPALRGRRLGRIAVLKPALAFVKGIMPALWEQAVRCMAVLKPAFALVKGTVPALGVQTVRWITTRKPLNRPALSRTIEQERPARVVQEGVPDALPSPLDRRARPITLRFDPARTARLTLSIDAAHGELTVTMDAQTQEEVYDPSQARNHFTGRGPHQIPGLSTLSRPPFPASTASASEGMGTQQHGNLSEQLARIFAAVLDVPVGRLKSTTNFFASGGDALALAALLRAIEREFMLTLRPEDVFAHAELSQLAELLSIRQKDISAGSHGGKCDSFAICESQEYAKATT